jgi:hypothetical protein
MERHCLSVCDMHVVESGFVFSGAVHAVTSATADGQQCHPQLKPMAAILHVLKPCTKLNGLGHTNSLECGSAHRRVNNNPPGPQPQI